MYIILAVLIFGVLVATHELGHFLAAKLCGVRVLEFSIGMGPVLWKKQGEETLYSWRLLPFGGFCAMDSEDEASEDPRAFTNQHPLKRAFILVAGSAVNFLVGFLIIITLYSGAQGFVKPVVTDFFEGCPYVGEDGFLAGDQIWKVNGERIYSPGDLGLFAQRGGPVSDIVLIRDGQKVYLKNYPLRPVEYIIDGQPGMYYGFHFREVASGPLATLEYSWYEALGFVRLVRISLVDLFGGAVSVKELQGPVGIVDMMNQVGQSAETTAAGVSSALMMGAFIGINLAVVNMLPIPALDGGRIVFLILTWGLEKILRRRINPRYEGYLHAAGLALLLGLMVFVLYNDIARMITG